MRKALSLLALFTLASATTALAQDDHDHGAEAEQKTPTKTGGHDAPTKAAGKPAHKEGGHDDHGEEGGEKSGDAELSAAQQQIAGIKTSVVKAQPLSEQISAPGEVMINAYGTTNVTTRIAAQAVRRHVRLGDHVKPGQTLVTLSSVEMAEAQGGLLEAESELRRVEKLGREVVSDRRFVTAQVAYQQAYAKVRAYGMTATQIDALVKARNAAKATGEFALLALQEGTVISDAFTLGELIEPGRVLFQVTDESSLRVKARLTPAKAAAVAVGNGAKIKSGKDWLQGKVVQTDHTLDETTRTLAVHIELINPKHQLHAGQFVETLIEGKLKTRGIAVPLAAVLRSPDGDWQVFVETAPGRFKPQEVEVLQTIGDQMVIKGIEEGTSIVTKGAFFVQSEIAKSGFSVHNH